MNRSGSFFGREEAQCYRNTRDRAVRALVKIDVDDPYSMTRPREIKCSVDGRSGNEKAILKMAVNSLN